MKVVIINGQNHKGSTYHIARMLAEKISADSDEADILILASPVYFRHVLGEYNEYI